MDFLEKLNLLMERHNYNKNSLSKASGIPYTTIDNWYKRGYDNLQLPTVKKLCSFFDTSLDFWLKEEITNPNYGKSNGFTIDYDEMEHIKKYRYIAEHSPEGAKTITYILDREHTIAKQLAKLGEKTQIYSEPLEFHNEKNNQSTRTLNYYQRLASAGTGQIVFDDVPVDLIEIPDIPEYDRVKYAIGVNGDSMEPLYYDGDILLVEPMQDVRVDEIGIFIVDGESLVKKRGKRTLISLNKRKKYPEIPIDEDTRCLGRVVDKITSPDNLYAALESPDFAALEQGADLLRAQSFGNKTNPVNSKNQNASNQNASPHPDISAFAHEDLAALDAGKIKMFKSGKKA